MPRQAKKTKKATYRYFVQKGGEWVNVDDLTEEERTYVRKWACRTFIEALGYRPVQEKNGEE